MEPTRTLSRHDAAQPVRHSSLGLWIAHHENAALIGRWLSVGRTPLELGRGLPLGPHLLDDARLSRQHARVEQHKGALRVVDLGSRNGTWVGGQPVESARLSDGDVVRLGDVLLVAGSGGLDAPQHPRILGVSPAIREVVEQAQQVAPHDATVLVLGEPGVGKELVAREIHRHSGATGRFVALNCAGVADAVLHSELFGHARGAFTGASGERLGLVREAEHGTLLLDEIGDATPSFQSSLLRLLQAGEVRPVGSDRVVQVKVRFVAATNRDLHAAVAQGSFRADLLSRLEQWVLPVPPLRTRRIDLAVLFRALAVARGGAGIQVDAALVERLLALDWPGNVRELEALVTRLSIGPSSAERWVVPAWLPAVSPPPPDAPIGRARPEPEALGAMLARHGGNVRAASRELGIGRNTLYRWLREAGLDIAAIRRDGG